MNASEAHLLPNRRTSLKPGHSGDIKNRRDERHEKARKVGEESTESLVVLALPIWVAPCVILVSKHKRSDLSGTE